MTLRTTVLLPFALTLLAGPAAAQEGDETVSFGGQNGADLSIEAIEPSDEPVRVGVAGEDPADIARYLLASGASGPALSPDGQTLAFSWSVTGERQLWVMDAHGGQPQRLTFGSGITFYRWLPDGSV
jgi:Tol biopolymer transport system component